MYIHTCELGMWESTLIHIGGVLDKIHVLEFWLEIHKYGNLGVVTPVVVIVIVLVDSK